jgi:predicted CoA-binding protein
MAVQRLEAAGHQVIALGLHAGKIGKVPIYDKIEDWGSIDTVTMYLNPYHQQGYYRYLIELKPERVIFNPGSENFELEALLVDKGIKCLNACTLVMLSTGQF